MIEKCRLEVVINLCMYYVIYFKFNFYIISLYNFGIGIIDFDFKNVI